MSHVVASKLRFKKVDPAILKALAAQFGGTYVEASTYKWYGRSVGDSKLPDHFTADMLGKCVGKMTFPGVGYEVGVAKDKNGNFAFVYDYWGPGQKLGEMFGHQGERLYDAYNQAQIKAVAQRQGHSTTWQKLPNGQTVARIYVQ